MDGFGFRMLSVSPKDISASKLGDLIKQYEIAIKREYFEATGKQPDSGGFVALSDIEDNCTTLRFFVAALFIAMGPTVGNIPKPNQFITSNLTKATRNFHRQIYDIGSLYNTPIESFVFPQDQPQATRTMSTIYPEEIAQASSARLRSNKTMYGSVVAVGGIDPKIKILLNNGESISCSASRELAQKAAGYLYDTVRVSGIAKTIFSLGQASLDDFTINSIEKFEPLSAKDLFEVLKPHITDQLNRIDDPDDYFRSLREDEE